MLDLTIVILTKNEALNLDPCVKTLRNVSSDIHVLDSGSTDGTQQIARENGLPVHEHPFSSFGDQRNWAIDHIPHRYDWVFHLDADERFTPALANEIGDLLKGDPVEAGFRAPSRLMIGDAWLKRSGEYPAYQVRLFHRERLRFGDAGHGQREVTAGQVGTLCEPFLHYPFSRGLEHWFQKHASYARQEAEARSSERSSLMGDLAGLLGGTANRRRALKRLSYRLPARGLFRLVHLLLIKRGILDGRAGILYARMKATYESMTAVQLAAMNMGLNVPCGVTESSEVRVSDLS
jgi:glycosyltransferase involved in cell wall biosynthesis